MTIREIVLEPKSGVYLGYQPSGFDAEAKDIGRTAQGWKNESVDIPQQTPPLSVGDYVILVVQVSPKRTKRAIGWVEEILDPVDSFGDIEPTPVGITLGIRDEQHRTALRAHYATN